MRQLMLTSAAVIALSVVDASAADLPTNAPYAPWNWTGLYLGAHVGGAWGFATFSDPFGGSIFGDKVHTPGFLGGGQIGYNWQAPGTNWVFGLEADLSALDSDGTNTCFASSPITVNATCRVRPQATGTLAGRVGFAVGPVGDTLIYGKGGLAWANDKIDMALNDLGIFGSSNSQDVNLWGETVGVGIERALTPAWSVKLEYDYLYFGNKNVANLGNVSFLPTSPFPIVGIVAPGSSSVSQNIQELKVGLNYKFGADPWAAGWSGAPVYAAKAAPMAVSPWEFEAGGRYVGSWGRFQKDFGLFTNSGFSNISDVSRLTYDDMFTNAGEFFGRIDTPWNLFVKGFVGDGVISGGHMNDEDFVLPLGGLLGAYSNTLSPVVKGDTKYGVIDAGFDFLRTPGYKVGLFGGYFALNDTMKAYGCTAVAFINCDQIHFLAVPTSGSPIITESDKWRAARVGVAAETMITNWLKIGGEVAYLPWVSFNGVDHHFFGNSGILAEEFPESGNGRGVQIEALVSYYLTPQWSIGVGGRYWGLWTSSGQVNLDILGGVPVPPTSPQVFRAQIEKAGAFVQTSYKFSIP